MATVPIGFSLGVDTNNLSKVPGVNVFAGVTDALQGYISDKE